MYQFSSLFILTLIYGHPITNICKWMPDTSLCDTYKSLSMAGRSFSPATINITEILLKLALNTISLIPPPKWMQYNNLWKIHQFVFSFSMIIIFFHFSDFRSISEYWDLAMEIEVLWKKNDSLLVVFIVKLIDFI